MTQLNCHKIAARFWCIVWGAQWVFKGTNLCLLLRIWTLSSWRCNCTDANPFSAWNNASKIAVYFTAVLLWADWVYSIGPNPSVCKSSINVYIKKCLTESIFLLTHCYDENPGRGNFKKQMPHSLWNIWPVWAVACL